MSKTVADVLFGVFVLVPFIAARMIGGGRVGGTHDPFLHHIFCILQFIATLIIVTVYSFFCVYSCQRDRETGDIVCVRRCFVVVTIYIIFACILYVWCLFY